jgi:hypothetical protein
MFGTVVSVGTAGYVFEEVTCHAAAAVIHVRQTLAALGILQHIIHDWDHEPALKRIEPEFRALFARTLISVECRSRCGYTRFSASRALACIVRTE